MSDNKAVNVMANNEKAPAAKSSKVAASGKVDVISARDSAPKVLKVQWTLDRCKRYARRYPTEAVWASSASASYKSAVAHGWKDECVREMSAIGPPVQQSFRKAA